MMNMWLRECFKAIQSCHTINSCRVAQTGLNGLYDLSKESLMKVKDTVKSTIQKLEFLCESYENDTLDEIENIEETVTTLSQEVRMINIASDQMLKKDLNTLQSALAKLTSALRKQQEILGKQVQEIHVHQRALHAYAMVANNN